jgi:hypothetical protein
MEREFGIQASNCASLPTYHWTDLDTEYRIFSPDRSNKSRVSWCSLHGCSIKFGEWSSNVFGMGFLFFANVNHACMYIDLSIGVKARFSIQALILSCLVVSLL